MKTKILFLLLAWVPMSVTIAQEPNDYHPFIEEGKVWIVGDGMWADTPMNGAYESVSLLYHGFFSDQPNL